MKTKIMMMLIASAAVMTACSSDDPFENAYNYMDPGMLGPGGDMMTGGAGGGGWFSGIYHTRNSHHQWFCECQRHREDLKRFQHSGFVYHAALHLQQRYHPHQCTWYGERLQLHPLVG